MENTTNGLATVEYRFKWKLFTIVLSIIHYITLFTALTTFCFTCLHSLLMKQYIGLLISQPKETPQCYTVSWNKEMCHRFSIFKMKSALRSALTMKTQKNTRAHSFWTSFFITLMVFGPKQNPPSFLQTRHFGPPSHSSGVSPEPWCITYLCVFPAWPCLGAKGQRVK